MDFTDGDSIYPKLRAELANLSIGILINNVGMTMHSPFVDIDPEEKLRDIINCNVRNKSDNCFSLCPFKIGLINTGNVNGTINKHVSPSNEEEEARPHRVYRQPLSKRTGNIEIHHLRSHKSKFALAKLNFVSAKNSRLSIL